MCSFASTYSHINLHCSGVTSSPPSWIDAWFNSSREMNPLLSTSMLWKSSINCWSGDSPPQACPCCVSCGEWAVRHFFSFFQHFFPTTSEHVCFSEKTQTEHTKKRETFPSSTYHFVFYSKNVSFEKSITFFFFLTKTEPLWTSSERVIVKVSFYLWSNGCFDHYPKSWESWKKILSYSFFVFFSRIRLARRNRASPWFVDQRFKGSSKKYLFFSDSDWDRKREKGERERRERKIFKWIVHIVVYDS